MSGTREWEKEAIVKEVYELSYRNMPDLRVPLVTPTSSKISLMLLIIVPPNNDNRPQ